jgi:hypothetical protein
MAGQGGAHWRGERGERGGGEGEGGSVVGADDWGGAMRWPCYRRRGFDPCLWWLLLCSVLRVCEEESRKEEGEEKIEKRNEEGKEKKKMEKMEKILKRKIKDNL